MTSVMNSTTENNLIIMSLSPDSRSTSPSSSTIMTPSPSRGEIRGIRLFRAISRKLARRSRDDLNYTIDNDGDSRSSSSDSCSSTSVGRCSRTKKDTTQSADSGFRSISPNHMSSSSSEAGSDIHPSSTIRHHRHHHSTSAESIRKVFQNLSLNTGSRSQSCSSSSKEAKRKTSKIKAQPKRILRAPVTYTYVKGLSGLPTQRIPKNQTNNRILMNSTCGCSMQYMAGLRR